MNNITKTALAAAIGVIVGAGGVMAFTGKTDVKMAGSEHVMPNGATMQGSMGMKDEMDGMMQTLDGKTGDAFDEAFLEEMTVHHQGAVAMAEAALKNAKHQEIKDLAQAIISAQNIEIKQMQDWKKSWYGK
ncbi:MAG: uncharacterized protein JWN64_415 [Parcubacteria group bacterium]|nr:uncharacterized protein [Parcubacteria group bacterium]